MLINPNLLDITKTTHTNASYDFNTKIVRVVGNYHASRVQYKLPDDLVVGQEYTFSCNINNIDGNNLLTTRAYPGESEIKELKSDGSRQSFTFKLNDKNTHIYLYLGINSKTYGSYKIYNEKLENGKKDTIYVPYKQSLETAKRQYFIGGGTFKEVYPL
ncbi:hypothetical protein [uncultured Anaerococcus sp.]|uniref:hypothetical protein n=1 Tax=uncultured Anaerococcus sp. TaxID=293428 RepID=UPI002804EFCF|nr:hypothetical protein [uncultured Anaerococcus sp.]